MTTPLCDLNAAVPSHATPRPLSGAGSSAYSPNHRAWAMCLAVAVAAMVAGPLPGQAPKYDVLNVEKLIDDNLKTFQREASNYATARDLNGFTPEKLAGMRRYFEQYVPAKLTQPDATHQINDVMNHARSVMDRGLRSQTPGSANVMRWLYAGLKPVAVGNYQPVARINAIQFISRLARAGGPNGLPVPYPFVLTDLKPIYDDAKQPDGVRAAALKGIEHYVRYAPVGDQALAAVKDDLIKSMTALLESPAPVGRDELAHAFLQRYAVSILTNMSTDASLGKQLVSISTDETKPNLIALHSAAAIANLPGKMGEGEVPTKEVLMSWSQRILDVYQSELDRLTALDATTKPATQPAPPESFLKETEKPVAAKPGVRPTNPMMMGMEDQYADMGMEMMDDTMDMMDMMGQGMSMSGMMGMTTVVEKPQPAEIIASRMKLNFAIQQVLLGVIGDGKIGEDVDKISAKTGLMASTPADSMDAVKAWLRGVSEITTLLNDKKLDTRRTYVTSLQDQVLALTDLANGKAVEPRAASEVPTFGFGEPVDMNDESAVPAEAPAAPPELDATIN